MQLHKTLGLACLSGFVALGSVAPAQAAYYIPTLDPAYGAAFPNLGWRAAGQLYVPDACEAAIGLGAFVLTPFGPLPDASCASAQLQSVTVSFYDTAAPPVTVETLNVGTFLWDSLPASTPDDVTQEMLQISYLGGDAVGLETSMSIPLLATHPLAGGGSSYFSLNFSSSNGRLVEFGTDALPLTYADRSSVSTEKAVFSIQRVPEPGSLVLVLAALVAGAGATRLRRR